MFPYIHRYISCVLVPFLFLFFFVFSFKGKSRQASAMVKQFFMYKQNYLIVFLVESHVVYEIYTLFCCGGVKYG